MLIEFKNRVIDKLKKFGELMIFVDDLLVMIFSDCE